MRTKHSYLVSLFWEKRIQFIIRKVPVPFINFPLPAICLHLLWCHSHLSWGRCLHLHGCRSSWCHATGTNHWGGATHLTGRCLIPSWTSLTSWSRCGSRCLGTSAICSRSFCPAWSGMTWSGMTWSFTFEEKSRP